MPRTPEDLEEHREKQISFGTLTGTPDLVRLYHSKRTILIRDLKFGFATVERAELNIQLRAYGVMAVESYSGIWETVYVAIVQPRAAFDERITIAKYTMEDIADARRQIQAILEASQVLDAPLVAGEDQCRYCKAKLLCPAFQEAMMVPAVLAPETALSKAAKEAYLAKRLTECSDEQLEKVMLADQLSRFAHDIITDEARKRIAAGGLTNYSLTKPTEVRSISDVRKALALLNLAGLPKDQIYQCVTNLSLTKLGDAVRKAHPTWDWKQVNEWVNAKLKTVLETETRKERVIRK